MSHGRAHFRPFQNARSPQLSLWSGVKQRRITQIVVGYLAGGWMVLTGIDQVVDRGAKACFPVTRLLNVVATHRHYARYQGLILFEGPSDGDTGADVLAEKANVKR